MMLAAAVIFVLLMPFMALGVQELANRKQRRANRGPRRPA